MEGTPVRQLLSEEVLAVSPADSLDMVVAALSDRRAGAVIVCEDEAPVGVISERDLMLALSDLVAGRTTDRPTAAELMTSPVHTVHVDDTIEEVATMVERERVKQVPVVDEAGKLVGIVHFADVVTFHTRLLTFERMKLVHAVEERTRELEAANERLRILSTMDGLLRIGNRRAMDEAVSRTHAAASRHGRTYGVALLDIDHFKKFNDRYGHPEADRVLREVAQALRNTLRESDSIYRYGGEEILALLPDSTPAGAILAGERLRRAVEDLGIEHLDSEIGVVTVSVGVSVAGLDGDLPERPEQVLGAADAALYKAKTRGRNMVAAERPGVRPGGDGISPEPPTLRIHETEAAPARDVS